MSREYKSYRFMDKDPIIDFMRTAVKDSGWSYQKLSEETGVSIGTFYNWFHGKTRKPQYATVMAVTRTLGYGVEFIKRRGVVVPIKRKVYG